MVLSGRFWCTRMHAGSMHGAEQVLPKYFLNGLSGSTLSENDSHSYLYS